MPSKILVVDDERAVCKILRLFLEDKGYSVVEAYSGDEAIEVYKRESPDVVLLDIRMPGKDGVETLHELKELDPEASVIMVTAVNEEDIAKEAMDEGAFEYITKPINREYLEMALMTKLALLGKDD
ncbi:MAG: response regulator [bacterium]|nr:response regulator [bacterium]